MASGTPSFLCRATIFRATAAFSASTMISMDYVDDDDDDSCRRDCCYAS